MKLHGANHQVALPGHNWCHLQDASRQAGRHNGTQGLRNSSVLRQEQLGITRVTRGCTAANVETSDCVKFPFLKVLFVLCNSCIQGVVKLVYGVS